jgi:hypothetical protein
MSANQARGGERAIIIFKKGAGPMHPIQVTGFNKRKVSKIIYKLFKHDEIRIESGGLYTGIQHQPEHRA